MYTRIFIIGKYDKNCWEEKNVHFVKLTLIYRGKLYFIEVRKISSNPAVFFTINDKKNSLCQK